MLSDTQLDELQSETEKLLGLLRGREPGIGMWWEFLSDRLKAIGQFSAFEQWRDLRKGETPEPGDRMVMPGGFMIYESGASLDGLFPNRRWQRKVLATQGKP